MEDGQTPMRDFLSPLSKMGNEFGQTVAYGKSDKREREINDLAMDKAQKDFELQRQQNELNYIQSARSARVMTSYMNYAGMGLIIIVGGLIIWKVM